MYLQVFLQDIAAELGSKVQYIMKTHSVDFKWSKQSESTDEQRSEIDGPQDHVARETVEQMQSKSFQACKLGFTQGAHVIEKQAETTSVWRISSIDDETVNLMETIDGKDRASKSLPIGQTLKEWRLYKGKVTCRLDGWDYESNSCSPLKSDTWQMECVKGAIAIALRGKFAERAHVVEHLELLQNPYMIKTKKDFKAGDLQLVAASQRIDKKSSKDAVSVGRFEAISSELFVTPQVVPPVGKDNQESKAPWVAPFWLVQGCEAEDEANMILKHETVVVGCISVAVPVLVNSRSVKADTTLCWKKKSKPLQGRLAKKAKTDAHPATEQEPAAKKQRKA